MKKLLLITFLFCSLLGFAQQNSNNSGVINKNQTIESILSLAAYPNPFTTKTRINFISTKDQVVEFTVKNLLGKTVHFEKVEALAGNNAIYFNRNNLTAGMYIYSLQTETEVVSKRLVIK
jgi:hypothetical protein